jgi:hypothetical protein
MNPYKIKIETFAKQDIQDGIRWYNSKKIGLGKEFHQEVKDHFEILKGIKFFQIRYDEVRCLPLKRFPYMIHFSVFEEKKPIIIRAVFNTNRNPEIWKKRS